MLLICIMPMKKSTTLQEKKKPEKKSISFLLPCSTECLHHLNQLFCYHLFVDLPCKTKSALLQQYFEDHFKSRTKKLDTQLSLYIQNLMSLHISINCQDPTVADHWKSMCTILQSIHAEMKSILLSKQHDDIIQEEKIITLEQVYRLQAELKAIDDRRNFTFSLSGR